MIVGVVVETDETRRLAVVRAEAARTLPWIWGCAVVRARILRGMTRHVRAGRIQESSHERRTTAVELREPSGDAETREALARVAA